MRHKPFYMIRHGESVANRFHYPSGQADSRLTQKGWAQARQTAALAAHLNPAPTHMIYSPLSRARETAFMFNQSLNLPKRHDRWLMEQHYGECQGVHKSRLTLDLEKWIVDPPGGEAFNVFADRVVRRMDYWLWRSEGVPVFVAHGGLFSAVCSHLDYAPHRVDNCAVYHFEPPEAKRGRWSISSFSMQNGVPARKIVQD